MHVTEKVESVCVIRSNGKLPYGLLVEMAERRRKDGKLKLAGISAVDIWCQSASTDGEPDDQAIAR